MIMYFVFQCYRMFTYVMFLHLSHSKLVDNSTRLCALGLETKWNALRFSMHFYSLHSTWTQFELENIVKDRLRLN